MHRNNVVLGHPLKLSEYIDQLGRSMTEQRSIDPYHSAIEDIVRYIMIKHMLSATMNERADPAVIATVRTSLQSIMENKLQDTSGDNYLKHLIEQGLEDPSDIILPEVFDMPPGSPIGCNH